jgi:hypothetical protein
MRRAPIPECIDRAQPARKLLAQQFEGELGHTTRYRALWPAGHVNRLKVEHMAASPQRALYIEVP